MSKKFMAAAIVTVAATGTAHAETDVLNLKGEIDYQCSLQLDAQTSSTVVSNTEYNDHRIGDMDIECNDAQGFTLDADTQNNFELQNGTFTFAYDLSLNDGAAVNKTFSDNSDAGVSTPAFDPTYAAGTNAVIQFLPDAGNAPVPGGVQLTDKVTFTIEGNV